MQKTYPYYLANQPQQPNADLQVFDKFTLRPAARVALADAAAIDAAIAASVEAAGAMSKLKPYKRQAILQRCAERFAQQADELALTLCVEAGKPIKDARGEVSRLIETFEIAAREAVQLDGQVLNLELSQQSAGRRGFVQKVPIGPCSFISPFNFPLNLVAHKVAAAIAAGCPFVLKPASRTPIGALQIGAVLAETNLPAGAFSILPCEREAADAFTTDPRLKLLSFTGSAEVGWELKAKAGKKKVVLELGGNAACIVHRDAKLDDAVERIVIGAFYQSGQSCISVQRILIDAEIYESVKQKLVAATESLVVGDPKDERTFVGPLISEGDAERLEAWISQAVDGGAKLLCGGKRDGVLLSPALLENVSHDSPLWKSEAFGPVAILQPYDSFDEALKLANASDFGLQAGVFTQDISRILQAWQELVVGGVLINDVPSWRVDNMPYGGVKDSGLGREGLRNAIADMSEQRLLVIRS